MNDSIGMSTAQRDKFKLSLEDADKNIRDENAKSSLKAAKGEAVPLTDPQTTSKARKHAGSASSKFIGVCWNGTRKLWRASIWSDGKQMNLGQFHSENDAARKYDEAASRFGRPLNFPPGGGGGDEEAVSKKTPAGGGGEEAVTVTNKSLDQSNELPPRRKSQFRGVTWHQQNMKWHAYIRVAPQNRCFCVHS